MELDLPPIWFIIGFVVLVSGFILFRVVVLWYWKIDKVEELLRKIEENTRAKRED